MRIDIIKEAQHNIIEAAMKGNDECSLDITNMFVTEKEEHEVVTFLINGMGMLAHTYVTNHEDEDIQRHMLHIGWSHITWEFDED